MHLRACCVSPLSLTVFHLLSHNLVMKHIPGADPELVLLNHYYEELDVSFARTDALSFFMFYVNMASAGSFFVYQVLKKQYLRT